jgi:hypothetical protein
VLLVAAVKKEKQKQRDLHSLLFLARSLALLPRRGDGEMGLHRELRFSRLVRLNKPISLRYGPRIAFVSFPTTPPSRFSSRRRLVPLASASPLSTGDSCAQFPRLAADELPRGVLGPPVPPRRGAPAPSIG